MTYVTWGRDTVSVARFESFTSFINSPTKDEVNAIYIGDNAKTSEIDMREVVERYPLADTLILDCVLFDSPMFGSNENGVIRAIKIIKYTGYYDINGFGHTIRVIEDVSEEESDMCAESLSNILRWCVSLRKFSFRGTVSSKERDALKKMMTDSESIEKMSIRTLDTDHSAHFMRCVAISPMITRLKLRGRSYHFQDVGRIQTLIDDRITKRHISLRKMTLSHLRITK